MGAHGSLGEAFAVALIGAAGVSWAGIAALLATLLVTAAYLAGPWRRWPSRRAAVVSTALGAAFLVGSLIATLTGFGPWPVGPALVALAAAHAGAALSRRRPADRPADAPPKTTAAAAPATRAAAPAPAPAARAAPRPAPAEAPEPRAASAGMPPDRATLGRYRIERQLGRGAMGAVYLGRDPTIGRAVAIKTMALSREFDGDALTEARQRFFREAETAGRLQHPAIVTIFDAGEDQDLAYIAMEYLRGHDLQRHTAAGALLPVPTVLRIAARVADALAYAHSQGVVHRDIKPANVMVDPEHEVVKVTDFGIARITDASRTRTGMVLGTPSFMSPEQMAGRRVDGRSDLYSLGVMLFQLLTGRLPHHAESMAKLMYAIANEAAPDVRTLRPDLPGPLADVVTLALEKRPEVRYASAQQLAADLRAVLAMIDPHAPIAAPTAEAAAPPGVDGFAATVKFERSDPGHNPGP